MQYRWFLLAGLLLLLVGIILNVVWTANPSSSEITASTAELGMMLLDDTDGVSVLAVQDGSMAERAGIRPTDLLMRLNGISFATVDELDMLLQGILESDICLYLIRSGCGMEICFSITP